jgi:hypothetical protein
VEPILKKQEKAELIKAKMTGVLWKLLQNQQVLLCCKQLT